MLVDLESFTVIDIDEPTELNKVSWPIKVETEMEMELDMEMKMEHKWNIDVM